MRDAAPGSMCDLEACAHYRATKVMPLGRVNCEVSGDHGWHSEETVESSETNPPCDGVAAEEPEETAVLVPVVWPSTHA